MNSISPSKNSFTPLADVNLCMHALPCLIHHTCMTTVYLDSGRYTGQFFDNYHDIVKFSSFLMFVIITMQFMLLPYWMKIEEFTKQMM